MVVVAGGAVVVVGFGCVVVVEATGVVVTVGAAVVGVGVAGVVGVALGGIGVVGDVCDGWGRDTLGLRVVELPSGTEVTVLGSIAFAEVAVVRLTFGGAGIDGAG